MLRCPPTGEPIYYITDGMPPLASAVDPARVHILEVSSPQRRRWKSFKEGLAAGLVDERYMPLVSLAEMLHLAPHVGTVPLAAAEVITRYKKLGGTARGVLVRSREAPEDMVHTALAHASSLDAVLSSSSTSGELEGSGLAQITSALIHFQVSEEQALAASDDGQADALSPSALTRVQKPYSHYEPVFASNYVRGAILRKFRSRFVALLGEMVRSADLPYTSVMQGRLYEEFVHKRIQDARANACQVRSLEPRAPSAIDTVDLCGWQCVEFDDIAELANACDGRYYKPISKSFGAVDFVLGRNIVGNMTLNLRHGISLAALLCVVRAMGFEPVQRGERAPVLSFYWMLPSLGLFQRMPLQALSHGGCVIKDAASSSTSEGQEMWRELRSRVRLQQFAVYMSPAAAEEASAAEIEASEPISAMDVEADDQSRPAAAAAVSVQQRVSGSKRKPPSASDAASSIGSASKRGGRGGTDRVTTSPTPLGVHQPQLPDRHRDEMQHQQQLLPRAALESSR
jgi:hypothetical protein